MQKDITDPLSTDAIQIAIHMRNRENNNVPLSSLLAIAISRKDLVKFDLIFQDANQFDCVIDDRGTTPLDFLAQCVDQKMVEHALLFCTDEQKTLYEKKKRQYSQSESKSTAPTSAKLSDKNFHKDSSNKPDRGKSPNQQPNSSRSCTLL